jgi:hypothetical protein
MGYKIHYSSELAHSKGPWKKHKYLRKVGNKYIYDSTAGTGSGGGGNPVSNGQKYGRLAAKWMKKFNAFKMSALAGISNYISNGKKFVSAFVAQYKRSMAPAASGPHSVNAANRAKIQNVGNADTRNRDATGVRAIKTAQTAAPASGNRGHVSGTAINKGYSIKAKPKTKTKTGNSGRGKSGLAVGNGKINNAMKRQHSYHESGNSRSSNGRTFTPAGPRVAGRNQFTDKKKKRTSIRFFSK